VQKDWPLATTCYLPLDTPANATRFIELINPKLAVFIRYEFWANYLDALYKKNIPATVIAAQFNKNQFAFKPYGSFLLKRIARLQSIMVQYQSAKDLLLENGFDSNKISVCGDSRFDRALETIIQAESISEIERFKGDSPLLLLGSCYKHEMEFVAEAVNRFQHWKVIYAPHWVDENYVAELESKLPEKSIRYTHFNNYQNERILVLNTIGKLAAAYAYANIAVVGGGFRDGIHNIIEPSAFGIPVFYGPNHQSFPEGQAMIDAGFGFEINEQNKMILFELMENEDKLKLTTAKSRDFVKDHSGATACITKQLTAFL
jgi:3-deoxy-D-manno-octulosonic-acid transferase